MAVCAMVLCPSTIHVTGLGFSTILSSCIHDIYLNRPMHPRSVQAGGMATAVSIHTCGGLARDWKILKYHLEYRVLPKARRRGGAPRYLSIAHIIISGLGTRLRELGVVPITRGTFAKTGSDHGSAISRKDHRLL